VSINALIATVFGAGRTPYAPGTAGSLVAAIVAWPLAAYFERTLPYGIGHWWLAACGLGVGLIGIYFSEMYAREIGDSDPPSCVIDEVAGQWIALAVAPLSFWAYFVGFALFRFFDIRKIWPADKAQNLPGGLGIVADDIVAGLLAALTLNLLVVGGYL
jgi:phosphatidylglycerophosphatase A